MPVRRALPALLIAIALAGCDRAGRAAPDLPDRATASPREKAIVAADTAKLEDRLRVADLERRVETLEAELAVGPATRDHIETELLRARVDKLELDGMTAAAAPQPPASVRKPWSPPAPTPLPPVARAVAPPSDAIRSSQPLIAPDAAHPTLPPRAGGVVVRSRQPTPPPMPSMKSLTVPILPLYPPPRRPAAPDARPQQ